MSQASWTAAPSYASPPSYATTKGGYETLNATYNFDEDSSAHGSDYSWAPPSLYARPSLDLSVGLPVFLPKHSAEMAEEAFYNHRELIYNGEDAWHAEQTVKDDVKASEEYWKYEVDKLIQVMESTRSHEKRMYAASALLGLEPWTVNWAQQGPALAQLAEHTEVACRQTAIAALSRGLTTRELEVYAPVLVRRLADDDHGVRTAAAAALDRMTPQALAPHAAVFAENLGHHSVHVRRSSMAAMKRLDADAYAVHANALGRVCHREGELGELRFAARTMLGRLQTRMSGGAYAGAEGLSGVDWVGMMQRDRPGEVMARPEEYPPRVF